MGGHALVLRAFHIYLIIYAAMYYNVTKIFIRIQSLSGLAESTMYAARAMMISMCHTSHYVR